MFIFADNGTQRTEEVTTMKLRNLKLQQEQNAPYRSNEIAILRTRVTDIFRICYCFMKIALFVFME